LKALFKSSKNFRGVVGCGLELLHLAPRQFLPEVELPALDNPESLPVSFCVDSESAASGPGCRWFCQCSVDRCQEVSPSRCCAVSYVGWFMVVLVCVQASAGMQFEWKGQRMQYRIIMMHFRRAGVGWARSGSASSGPDGAARRSGASPGVAPSWRRDNDLQPQPADSDAEERKADSDGRWTGIAARNGGGNGISTRRRPGRNLRKV
jgi:hypothetical protein